MAIYSCFLGKNLKHLKIRLHDIKLATHNFSDKYKTESNGHTTWYTTELSHFNKEKPSLVVIKHFLPGEKDDEEELFLTELEMLTSVKHHNIVTLIGFCVEGFDMMLVIEKFSNGFLRDYLGNVKNMRTLTWEKRLKICIDVAQALNYLHSEMEDKKIIIHTTLHNSSLGLDENWGAKIEDFQWAIFLPPNNKDGAMSKITYSNHSYYMDPEYAKTGMLKRESDVYSFGVILFEILCGRHADDQIYLNGSEKGLIHVARRKFHTGKIEDMIDPTLKEEIGRKSYVPNRGATKDSFYTFLEVAHQCVAEVQDQRPTMKVVLKELQKALFLQVSQLYILS
ncbi:putative protein kinase RLK-Pelle-LRR-I-1 family [Helianthus anomalus]